MTNEELRQEVKRLEEQIKDLKIKLEEKAERQPYEVEVPEDIENYYFLDETGNTVHNALYSSNYQKKTFMHGLAFKTREEAEQHDKERILLFKLHKWAEEHNEGWTPNWKDFNEEKWTVMYYNESEEFEIYENYRYREFLKLPYFKLEEIAKQFIKEFGEEIKEVLL